MECILTPFCFCVLYTCCENNQIETGENQLLLVLEDGMISLFVAFIFCDVCHTFVDCLDFVVCL